MRRGLALILATAALVACVQQRGLKITEVGPGRVELYLHEERGRSLNLRGQTLAWRMTDPSGANPPVDGRVELVGDIDSEEFIVVFEDANQSAGAVTSGYRNFFNQSFDGIAVPTGALGPVDATRAYAFRVSGHHFRYIFPFFYTYEDTDDEVRFGPSPRPNLGGGFQEDGSLEPVTRTEASGLARGQTLRRHTLTDPNTGVETPIDRNLEADWKDDDESYGTAD